MSMQTTIAVCLIIFAAVCLIAYLSLWNAIDDIKNSLDFIKRMCNNACEIKQSEHTLHELITKSHKELLTEIACLATKNNEDIKRSKEGFQVGDVIAYAGEETLVLDRETVTLNNREELTDYIIWNVSKGIQHETASHLEHNAIFLRRASLNG